MLWSSPDPTDAGGSAAASAPRSASASRRNASSDSQVQQRNRETESKFQLQYSSSTSQAVATASLSTARTAKPSTDAKGSADFLRRARILNVTGLLTSNIQREQHKKAYSRCRLSAGSSRPTTRRRFRGNLIDPDRWSLTLGLSLVSTELLDRSGRSRSCTAAGRNKQACRTAPS